MQENVKISKMDKKETNLKKKKKKIFTKKLHDKYLHMKLHLCKFMYLLLCRSYYFKQG